MKNFFILILILSLNTPHLAKPSPKHIFKQNKNKICLVSFYQNIASDARIGSYDKLERHRIGIFVDSSGLVMVSNDVYPASLDVVSLGGSLLSEIPTDFKVKLQDGKEITARFLGKDDRARVAFIQLEDSIKNRNYPYIKFSSSEKLGIADTIYVLELLNQNYNFEPLFTAHMIHAVIESPRRKFLVNNYSHALSAGGLVLDNNGQSIGVTIKQDIDFSFLPPGDFEEFHKEYLEIAPTEWFVEQINNPPNIQENQLLPKAWLGIRMQALSKELQKYWQVPQDGGIIINQIFPESPAEKAKLQVGDIILAVNDSILNIKKDEETTKFRNIILTTQTGTDVKFKIFRNGKTLEKKIKLTAAPKSISLAQNLPIVQLGFEIRELTRDIIYQENLPLNTPGVFIYQVDRASPAGIGGLQIGDIIQEINGESINDFNDAKRLLEQAQKESLKRYMLKVLSNRSTRFVFIDLNK